MYNEFYQLPNRDEFIDEFEKEKKISHKNSLNNSIDNNIKIKKWDYLYSLDKIKKDKLKEQIEEKRKKDEEDLISECTFTPKINKNNNFDNSFSLTNYNYSRNNIYNNLDFVERNKIWNKIKQNKINNLSKTINDIRMKECYFLPEINKENCLKKIKIKNKTCNLLEDPESYNQFIKRLKNKRDMIELQKKIENSSPGSGLIWNNKPKTFNLEYDYRNHLYTDRILQKSKSNKNLNDDIKNENSFDNKINIQNYRNIDRDEYYEKIYLKNSNDINFNNYNNNQNYYINNKNINNKNNDNINNNINNNINYNNIIQKENNILFNKPIDYNKAVLVLHNELYSFNLLSEEYY